MKIVRVLFSCQVNFVEGPITVVTVEEDHHVSVQKGVANSAVVEFNKALAAGGLHVHFVNKDICISTKK